MMKESNTVGASHDKQVLSLENNLTFASEPIGSIQHFTTGLPRKLDATQQNYKDLHEVSTYLNET